MTPRTRAVVETNLALGGVPTGHYRLLAGPPISPETRALAGDRSYGLIVIDLDDSAESVCAALRWAVDVAIARAVVIVDDSRNPARSAVGEMVRYVDAAAPRLRLLGTAAGSAFLRCP